MMQLHLFYRDIRLFFIFVGCTCSSLERAFYSVLFFLPFDVWFYYLGDRFGLYVAHELK